MEFAVLNLHAAASAAANGSSDASRVAGAVTFGAQFAFDSQEEVMLHSSLAGVLHMREPWHNAKTLLSSE